jgi:hypothetical protein
MRNFSKHAIAAALSAIAMGSIGIGAAAAADVATPQYRESQEYYREAPIEERYVYRRAPAVYAAPPPAAYYEYEPGPVVLLPQAYYLRRPYAYGARPYAFRGYRPYVARGYGRHEGSWSYGRHRW